MVSFCVLVKRRNDANAWPGKHLERAGGHGPSQMLLREILSIACMAASGASHESSRLGSRFSDSWEMLAWIL